ncbi:MAG TPA: hypothetical protein VFC07_04065, partial [Verrucomicrobiae bacterium]|nr:hypothetical protein [Verrucomicrobiae bacterium]
MTTVGGFSIGEQAFQKPLLESSPKIHRGLFIYAVRTDIEHHGVDSRLILGPFHNPAPNCGPAELGRLR